MASIFSPDKKTSFAKRLLAGTRTWQKLVETPLKNRAIILKALQSGYYSGKQNVAHPINLIDRGISILLPYLVMNNPKVLITSKHKELRPYALTSELAYNHLIKEIKFARRTLRPAVRDALMGLGIVKTGIMKSHEVEIFGYTHSVGEVYSDSIDLVDYIGDPTGKTFEDFEFEGNFYRMPLEAAKDLFPKHADILSPSFSLHGANRQYDPEKIAKDSMDIGMYTTLHEFVELADYWIPDENVIITVEPRSEKILMTREAENPEGGPYDKLFFKDSPGTPIPIPPVWYWLDMDSTINIIVNKMKKQAASQKVVIAYEGDAADDVARLASAGDRGTVKVSNAEGLKNIEWPGIDPGQYQWVDYLEQQFSVQASNAYTLGGRNSQAGTLGQEQMLMANASKSVDDMYQAVYEFAASIAKKITWYFWTDPLIQVPEIKRIEGFGDIPVMYDKVSREGEFWDYALNIEPYSMQRLNPSIELQRMMGLLTQWILPTLQPAAQQGVTVNFPEATKQLAKLSGIRELDKWYETGVPANSLALNPYQPQQGVVKGSTKDKGIQDGRTGSNPASSEANSRQKLQTNGQNL